MSTPAARPKPLRVLRGFAVNLLPIPRWTWGRIARIRARPTSAGMPGECRVVSTGRPRPVHATEGYPMNSAHQPPAHAAGIRRPRRRRRRLRSRRPAGVGPGQAGDQGHPGRPDVGGGHHLQREPGAGEGPPPRHPGARHPEPRLHRRQRPAAAGDGPPPQRRRPARRARAELRVRPADAGEAAREFGRRDRQGRQDQSRDRRRDGRGRQDPQRRQRPGAEDRRPHRDRLSRPRRLRQGAGPPPRPPDPGAGAAERQPQRAAGRAQLSHRRPRLEGRLRRRAGGRREDHGPLRLGHPHQHQRLRPTTTPSSSSSPAT